MYRKGNFVYHHWGCNQFIGHCIIPLDPCLYYSMSFICHACLIKSISPQTLCIYLIRPIIHMKGEARKLANLNILLSDTVHSNKGISTCGFFNCQEEGGRVVKSNLWIYYCALKKIKLYWPTISKIEMYTVYCYCPGISLVICIKRRHFFLFKNGKM